MPQVSIRSGATLKTSSRRVTNIIFESASEISLEYINYFYSTNDRNNAEFFAGFNTGIPFEAFTNKIEFNNLELDGQNNETSYYYPVGVETGRNDNSGFSSLYGNPRPLEYNSLFNEVVPGKFTEIVDANETGFGLSVILENDSRRTATKPFIHNSTNKVFHFSLASRNITSSTTGIKVNLYRSTQDYNEAISNLDTFYSGNTSTFIQEFNFNIDSDFSWNHKFINLDDIDLPAGECLLWFEFERQPQILENPFSVSPFSTKNFNLLFNGGWIKFSHGAIDSNGNANYPNISSEIEEFNFGTPDNLSGAANADRIRTTINSRSYIGMVSNNNIRSYNFQVDLKSTSADDDTIGVVIGYVRENGYEYTLSAIRTCGGMFGGETWALITNIGQSIGFGGNIISNPIMSTRIYSGSATAPSGVRWNLNPNGTTIRIEKDGPIVKAFTSQFDSNTIDQSTLIEINLNDFEDTKRFINSRFGISNFSQGNVNYENFIFENNIGSISETDAKIGQVGIGGFALERAEKTTQFANPKATNEFIESISSEKFVIEGDESTFVEKYNNFTFELYEAKEKFGTTIEFIDQSKFKYTILDYNNISMILQSGKATFEFSPFTGAKGSDLFLGISEQLYFGKSIFAEIIDILKPSQNLVIDRSFGNFRIKEDIVNKIIDVQLSGIKYEFDYSRYLFNQQRDLVGKELTLSEYQQITNQAIDKFLGDEIVRSEYQVLSEQEIVQKNGLFFFEFKDTTSTELTRSFSFGPQKDIFVPINYGFDKYSDSAFEFKRFTELAKDLQFDFRPFIEIDKDTTFVNKIFKSKISIFKFDFPKTVFFEDTKDIQFNVKPFYTETLDKTYINKLFFVDMDMYDTSLSFSEFKYDPNDVSYFIEEYFLKSKTTAVDPKNLFKKQIIEEFFKPNFRIIDSSTLEFFFDSFIGISSNLWDSNKFQTTYYDVWTSDRPKLGGSNAFGHTVTNLRRAIVGLKDQSILPPVKEQDAGRSGAHTTGSYKETQVVHDINSNFLFEFSEIDWDLNTNSSLNEDWAAFNSSNNFFNFLYTVDETSGRLPECLELTTDGKIKGKLSETDKFIRKYAYEQWTKEQGYTDNDGNFISHFDSLDYDYSDFLTISPREFFVKINGVNITKGTIDVILNSNSTDEFSVGEKVTQGETEFFIVSRLGSFEAEINLGSGIENRTIVRYEIDRIQGDIEIVREEVVSTSIEVSSLNMLQNELAELQLDLQFVANGSSSQNAEVLREQIFNIQSRIDLFANPNYDPNDPNSQQFIESDESKIVALGSSTTEFIVNSVTGQQGLILPVHEFVQDNSGAVSKEITVVFRIYNNYTFDRDLFLHQSDLIDDSNYLSRREWILDKRNNNQFKYDPSINNAAIDAEMILIMNQFKDSIVDTDEYLFKKNYLITVREYSDPDQRQRYIDLIDSAIYEDTTFRSNKYLVDNYILNQLNASYFNNNFPIDSFTQRFTYLEDISDDNNNFRLNCLFDVDEQTFYENTDDIRIIRGYPVYASCN